MQRKGRWLVAFGISAGLVVLLDPRARRRQSARRYLRRLVNDARSRLGPQEVPDDELIRRVQQRLAHVVRDPERVKVEACHGYVTLLGHVDAHELLPLCRAVAAVSGVEYVENRCCRPDGLLCTATVDAAVPPGTGPAHPLLYSKGKSVNGGEG